MRGLTVFGIATIAAFALSPDIALSQQSLREQLIGAWMLVSNDSTAPDGTKREIFGPSPKGVLILAANGQYTQIIVRSDVPKFKVNNRLQGTPEENTAAVLGTVAHFGAWSVDEASKTLTRRVDGSLFPNQAGVVQRTSVVLTADALKVSNPSPGSGGTSEQVFKRAN